ncbi:hypothetical protein M413DRAFT_420902 [Hebeloma cylindrosporum]|uniref:Uncharacterized protein n=1 Tax=Hebeloma cylindrosporum TaxID=76867 RepID=A0A0C2XKI7_HEBCY|nr:hypothetical protein M413DRAFT_420902 [Hebeloma cylindrosporum h7]
MTGHRRQSDPKTPTHAFTESLEERDEASRSVPRKWWAVLGHQAVRIALGEESENKFQLASLSSPPIPTSMSEEIWPPNDGAPSSSIEGVLATSTIVLTVLRSAGSTVPGLAVAAEIALRIITLVQNVKDNDAGFVDLANDASGLVSTLVIEYKRITSNGLSLPVHSQKHIQTLSENLLSIEKFTKEKIKRNRFRKMLSQKKDAVNITRYRDMLRQSLTFFELQSSISIQEHLKRILDQLQRAEMDAEARRCAEEERRVEEARRLEAERRAREEQATLAEIKRIQEEDRIARMSDDAIRAQHAEAEQAKRRLRQQFQQEESARIEFEQEAARHRMGRTPSPAPQPYPHPGFPVPGPPMNSYMYNPHSYPTHLMPPPPFYPPPQGGFNFQNVSGSNISISATPPPLSPPVHVNNINSGNVSNVSISNINNNNGKARRKPKTRT